MNRIQTNWLQKRGVVYSRDMLQWLLQILLILKTVQSLVQERAIVDSKAEAIYISDLRRGRLGNPYYD